MASAIPVTIHIPICKLDATPGIIPTANPMSILKHHEDRVNFFRALVALPILLAPFLFGLPNGIYGVLVGVGIWFLLSDMNFLLHQHVHNEWTNSWLLNLGVDLLLSVVTGMSAFNWRISHVLRHHQGKDSWGEGFHWEMNCPSVVGAVSYSLRGVPIVFSYPIWESLIRGFFSKETGFPYRSAFIEQLFVLGAISILTWYQPFFYAPYYVAVLFFSRLTDYENHVGCEESSEYGFSNNCLNANYNKVRQNFGFHTAHHYFPDAHWTELPKCHEQIKNRIPTERFTMRCWTGYWTPPGLVNLIGILLASRSLPSKK